MDFDAQILSPRLQDVPQAARAAESIGIRTLWLSETQHDPFLPGPLIAEHTRTLRFGTAVAISFSRSPTNLAYTAWDLAQASRGRFVLGLGTQVKAHIEKRFGMPWPESVVGKLREQIHGIRALWHTWQTGEPLKFRGEYHRLTLMTPFFNPGPIATPEIPIYIAGVNTGLARLAGEASDGFIVHPFHSPRYLREVVYPAIEEGTSAAGRPPGSVRRSVTVFVATNQEEASFARQQIAFYASTPSYRGVMALHGWGGVAEELSVRASRKRWDELPALIDDQILETFTVVADPNSLPQSLLARYEGLADHLAIYLPFIPGQRDDLWNRLAEAVNGVS